MVTWGQRLRLLPKDARHEKLLSIIRHDLTILRSKSE